MLEAYDFDHIYFFISYSHAFVYCKAIKIFFSITLSNSNTFYLLGKNAVLQFQSGMPGAQLLALHKYALLSVQTFI